MQEGARAKTEEPVEPGGPQIGGADTTKVGRVLAISANGTYHRVYDPCIPKWLNQAGVKIPFRGLETVGISRNSHMMMLEKNSDDIIEFIVSWMQKNTTT